MPLLEGALGAVAAAAAEAMTAGPAGGVLSVLWPVYKIKRERGELSTIGTAAEATRADTQALKLMHTCRLTDGRQKYTQQTHLLWHSESALPASVQGLASLATAPPQPELQPLYLYR